MTYIIYAFWIISTLLGLLSIYYIIKKHPKGIKSLYFLFGINILIILIGVALQAMDIDLAREIFSKSREVRGLGTKNMDQIVSPLGLIITSLAYILLYGYLVRYIHKTRSYFNDYTMKNITTSDK